MNTNHHRQPTSRENFLLSLLNKVVKEYRALQAFTRRSKPFKIIEITTLSAIPGESRFNVQVTNKNCVLHLSAADIIHAEYDLNDFSDFHAEMIRQAARGTLIYFLQASENKFKIVSKKFDKQAQQFIFNIQKGNEYQFIRTADEISRDKKLLSKLETEDVYDVGYTQGSESIIKETVIIRNMKNTISENT